MFCVVVVVIVDVYDEGVVDVFVGSGDDDFFGVGFKVGFGFFVISEEFSGFDDDFGVEFFLG